MCISGDASRGNTWRDQRNLELQEVTMWRIDTLLMVLIVLGVADRPATTLKGLDGGT